MTLTAPSKKAAADVLKDVDLQVLEQEVARKAGVDGVLLAVRGSGAEKKKTTARLRVDYSGFAGMYGGDWASRLTASAWTTVRCPTRTRRSAVPDRRSPFTTTSRQSNWKLMFRSRP